MTLAEIKSILNITDEQISMMITINNGDAAMVVKALEAMAQLKK